MAVSGHASGSAVVAVVVTFTVLATLAALSRIITRVFIVRKEGLDDICISFAVALTIALTVTMCQQVNYGMGRHVTTLSPNDVTQGLIWFWASVWIYYLALCFVKISIVLQYLRVFPTKGFRRACYVLMGVIIAYSIGTFFSSIFVCTPIESFWNPKIDGTCVNQNAVWWANTSINIVTDITTACLPLPVLNTLQLPKKQKYMLMGVFALGGFTCIISIIRLQALYVVSVTDDISWDNPLAAIYSSTEVNVGILCSCIPTLKGLVSRFFPNLFSTQGHSLQNSRSRGLGQSGQRTPQRNNFNFGFDDHELSGREKSAQRSQIYAENGYAPAHGTSWYEDNNSQPKDIMVHKVLEQDIERADDETMGSRESIRNLNRVPPSYHVP